MTEKVNPDLVEQFVKEAELTTATVEKIPANSTALNEALIKATRDDDQVLLSAPDDLDPGLFSIFRDNSKVVTKPDPEQLATIRTGITDAFCGVAVSGSVCVSVTNNFSSAFSMLTHKHIVILHASTILLRPGDAFSIKNSVAKGANHSFTFITGTSATADMGSLVRGVHGPAQLHIIILEQE